MNPSPLPRSSYWGYGFGDFSQNILFQVVAFYLLFYLTETVGMSAAVVGTMFLAARIWDAINDPLMGYLSSRTRTRWGSYRTYLLLGIPGLVGAMYWLFAVPSTGEDATTYVVIAYLAYGMAFTFYNIPYGSMTAVITIDYHERGKLTGYRMTFAALGGIVGATCFLPLVEYFGGGAEGFRLTAAIFAGIILVTTLPTFFLVKERIQAQVTELPTLGKIRSSLASNAPFWWLCLAFGATYCAYSLFASTIPYATKYLFEDESLTTPLILTLITAMGIAIPFWSWLATNMDKKNVFLIGSLLFVVTFLILGMIPAGIDPVWVYVIFGIKGFGYGAGAYTSWALLPDTVEFGTWKTGQQSPGITYGVYGVFFKLGLGLGAAMAGWVLAGSGYVQGAGVSAEINTGIRLSISWLPLILTAVAWWAIWKYPITAKLHQRIKQDIASSDPARQ